MMKSVKKAIIAALCAGTLVVGSVAGTMAYLTDTKTVTNTFTVGKVAITLDETDVDINGVQNGTTRVTANQYKLMPGHTYTKDPIVHVDSKSEDCYLFVKVDNEITAIEGDTTVAGQMAAKGWVVVSEAQSQAEETVYVYKTDESNPAVVTKSSNVTVFDNFTVAGTVDNTTLATYANKTIKVTAYAIQADGFEGKTAAEIWKAANFN